MNTQPKVSDFFSKKVITSLLKKEADCWIVTNQMEEDIDRVLDSLAHLNNQELEYANQRGMGLIPVLDKAMFDNSFTTLSPQSNSPAFAAMIKVEIMIKYHLAWQKHELGYEFAKTGSVSCPEFGISSVSNQPYQILADRKGDRMVMEINPHFSELTPPINYSWF
ncbi:MAG: hypothetical protein ACRCXZ_02985 [Patescibacteria group bacterium]